MPKLVNKTSRTAYLLEGQAVVIGRHMSCSIRVLERRVSRMHCAVLASESGWVLRDAASRLGTYVNGQFVAQPHRLQNGDRIKVGRTELVFEEKDDVDEGVKLERVRSASAEALNLAEAEPAKPAAAGPPRRRAWPMAAAVAVCLLGLAAALVFQVAPLLRRDTASRAVRRAAELVRQRRAPELWAMLSSNRRFKLSVEELQDRLAAIPEAAVVALRSLQVGQPQATNRGVVVPVAIRVDGEFLQGEVVLFREGNSWKIHSAPIEWAQRLGQ